MSFLDNIKLIASELANMSPKTQLEIVKLCKNLCIEAKNYLVAFDETTLPALNQHISQLDTHVAQLDTLYDNLSAELETAEGNISANANAIELLQGSVEAITEALSGIYTKSQVDTLLSAKANASDVYTKSQVDMLLNGKAGLASNNTFTGSNDFTGELLINGNYVATEDYVDMALNGKQNKLYLHNININSSTNNITLQIITNNDTPFTHNTICDWLYEHNFRDNNNHCYICTGFDSQDYDGGFVRGIYAVNPQDDYELDIETVSLNRGSSLVKSSVSLDSSSTIIDDIISL